MQEPLQDACDVLASTFERLNGLGWKPDQREALRRYLCADLASKSATLHVDIQRNLWDKTHHPRLPDVVRNRIAIRSDAATKGRSQVGENPAPLPHTHRVHADVCIVTVIPKEYDAVLRAFGIDPQDRPSQTIRGRDFYAQKVTRRHQSDLSVYVTMIGQPRNGPCINACRDIFENFNLGACILVGIAGGRREKVRLGDVVASLQVHDIEGGKSKLRYFGLSEYVVQRPQDYRPPDEIKQYILNLDPGEQWQDSYHSVLQTYRTPAPGKAINEDAWTAKPSLHRADIVVGEKVLANGKLPRIARDNDEVYAVEMEGSGFASACEHCRVPWMIIRGITDYADKHKNDGWHVPASVAAATLTRIFLQRAYRNEEMTY
ncbi:MAG: phosphorylase [Rhodocyclaceae bacterium]|nr:MAG: phosphorylase [Rhodocyclaceae bacterium]TND02754.1 MAG: phosphorylase [Rhodocyclaceae bacterium]